MLIIHLNTEQEKLKNKKTIAGDKLISFTTKIIDGELLWGKKER